MGSFLVVKLSFGFRLLAESSLVPFRKGTEENLRRCFSLRLFRLLIVDCAPVEVLFVTSASLEVKESSSPLSYSS